MAASQSQLLQNHSLLQIVPKLRQTGIHLMPELTKKNGVGEGLLGPAQEGFWGEESVVFVGSGGWNHKV